MSHREKQSLLADVGEAELLTDSAGTILTRHYCLFISCMMAALQGGIWNTWSVPPPPPPPPPPGHASLNLQVSHVLMIPSPIPGAPSRNLTPHRGPIAPAVQLHGNTTVRFVF